MKQQIHGGDIYRHPNALDFSSNINPLGTPPEVIRATAESLQQLAHYPDVRYEKLRTALADHEQVPPEWLICGNGAAELIFTLVRALKPQKALLPAPTFAEYGQALETVECQVVHYYMKDFRVQTDILEALTSDLDIVFLCNPNNPTGFLIEPMLLQKILRQCREKNIFVMLDECFLDFVDEGALFSVKHQLVSEPTVFILKAFTKRYAMAGIRLGYGLCSQAALLEKMERMTQPWNVSIPAQAAGCAALKEADYVKRAGVLVSEQREYMKEQMRCLPLQIFDSQANYIFFRGPADLYERCLEEGILLRDCSNYPGLEKGYYRAAVRMPDENQQLLDVLKKVLNKGGLT